jgi:thymidylate kinase
MNTQDPAAVALQGVALRPGAVVVFEGLDKAGKSTQLDRLKRQADPTTAVFAHMPSGRGLPDAHRFTDGVYDLLENHAPVSGLGRQLAHLACHCEHVPTLVDAARSKGLVLDRWWWSTLAYGWYGRAVQDSGITETTFRDLIATVWEPIQASIIFLFLTPREIDANNVAGVEDGYRGLATMQPGKVHLVPALTEDETYDYIVQALVTAGLATIILSRKH